MHSLHKDRKLTNSLTLIRKPLGRHMLNTDSMQTSSKFSLQLEVGDNGDHPLQRLINGALFKRSLLLILSKYSLDVVAMVMKH